MKQRPPQASTPQAPDGRDRASHHRAAPETVWSAPVAAADIPETGRQIQLVADAPTREAIAKIAGLLALPQLEASFDLTRQGLDGLHVAGRVAATVEQSCVVTLEPIQNKIDEQIDLVFTSQPEQIEAASEDMHIAAEEAVEPPEILQDGAVDLGALAMEFLLLAIDPYPRKPDATFDAPAAADDPASHPFAALAALKKGARSNDR